MPARLLTLLCSLLLNYLPFRQELEARGWTPPFDPQTKGGGGPGPVKPK